MARWGDSVKRREWSERLARFARWDGTVTEFCDAERVSAPSFYQWRRKLAASGNEHGRRTARETPRTFLPVQLVSATSAAPVAATTVEIELPNGALIRLPAPDRQLLATAIAAAGRVAIAPGEQPAAREEAAC